MEFSGKTFLKKGLELRSNLRRTPFKKLYTGQNDKVCADFSLDLHHILLIPLSESF